MKKYKYKFSVIIPVYKVEKYLEETIISIIKQTVGFKKNIQIVLVNDGSPDNSEEICKKYVQKFPDNIIYVKQKNQGVSIARNNGIKYAEGKYVNFLDSDDTWEKNAFQKVYSFFEEHEEEIDLVAGRMKFFDGVNGFSHALDYKFREHGDEIININEIHNMPQFAVTSAFIKTEVAKKFLFDSRLKYSEDSVVCAKIILEKQKYGLSTAIHNYRKRKEGTSAIQTAHMKKTWYIDTILYCYQELFEYSRLKFGHVIPYIQYQIMYDLQWRVANQITNVINEEEKKEYINKIKELLQEIAPEIIFQQRNLDLINKLYTLKLKYGKEISNNSLTYQNNCLFYKDLKVFDFKKNVSLIIKILEIENDNLKIEGQIYVPTKKTDYQLYFIDEKNKKYKPKFFPISIMNRKGIDGIIYEPLGFKLQINISNIKSLSPIYEYRGKEIIEPFMKFGPFAKLHPKYKTSYYSTKKYIIKSIKTKSKLNIYKNKILRHIELEVKFWIQLLRHLKIKQIIYRSLYFILKPFLRNPIWIVSDRSDCAGDNGEVMFQYLRKHEKKAKVYYVISKKSPDYNRLKLLGNILDIDSLKYKILFLHSNKIISSQANDYIINPFGKSRYFYNNLYQFDFVFLQHGITKEDLSSWLFIHNKNIKLFITSNKREYQSIIEGNYGYDSSVVKLTGMPRYDNLNSKNKNKNKIIVMPTWRKNLAGRETSLGVREYNENFKESEYYQFYNNLLNNKELLETLKKMNYKIEFFMHPLLSKQSIDFQGNELAEIHEGLINYQKEFNEASLLLTDYSSVSFDFAYLKKPVIYSAFDINTFYEGQLYDEGYFDTEKDGFGEVCYNEKETIYTLIQYLKNDCKLKEKYKKRIEAFYDKFDKNNCQRVHKEILKIERNK